VITEVFLIVVDVGILIVVDVIINVINSA